MKKVISLMLMFSLVWMTGCQAKKTDDSAASSGAADGSKNPTVTISVKDFGDIVVEMNPTVAPNTVKNFMKLASEGFYDGLTFHRVISGFMIQGGDPDGVGTGGPGYSIKGEFNSNGVENPLKHTRGVISMARAQAPDSAGSQFFIMHADSDFLDGEYAAFGQVISGIEVVDKIAEVSKDAMDKPEADVVIEKMTVDAKGFDFATVETIQE